MKKLLHFSLVAATALYFGACGGSSEPVVLADVKQVQTGMEGVVKGTGVIVANPVIVEDTQGVADNSDSDIVEVSKVEKGILARPDSPTYKSLFFPANNGITGVELYQYDLEDSALKNPISIRTGPIGSFPAGLNEVDGKIYMSANDGVNGRELWIYDGTTGIARIWNVNVNNGIGSNPTFLTHLDGKIYFSANGGNGEGRELFYYDIANNRHVMITNHILQTLRPGVAGSNPRDLVVQNGVLYFAADSGNGAGAELYRYDPSIDEASGPQMIANVAIFIGSNPRFMADIGGKIYFSARTILDGRELWVYDRATNTHSQIRDINPGGGSSNPQFATEIDGKIFFSANDGHLAIGPNRELMMYDTQNDVMTTVADISLIFGSDPRFLAYMNGDIYFAGFRAATLGAGIEYTGIELWKYNISSQNASLVDNISQGAFQDSDPFWIVEANGMLYFGAFTPLNGRELWKSDGENPSVPLGNFRAGVGNFLPDATPGGADYGYPYSTILRTTWN
jgi:ELWxxDGT repeat protein